jgi:hypothetical protein
VYAKTGVNVRKAQHPDIEMWNQHSRAVRRRLRAESAFSDEFCLYGK